MSKDPEIVRGWAEVDALRASGDLDGMRDAADVTMRREAWYAARVQEIINTISNSVGRQQERSGSGPDSEAS